MADEETLEQKAKEAAARAAAEAAAKAAAAAVGKAADEALDAVETWIFGKVGGAEEVVRREESADPLERLRAQYGAKDTPKPATRPSREEAEAAAKRQLEELKRKMAQPAPAEGEAPKKKSL